MIDVRFRNGRVYTPAGPVDADLLVSGERIAGLVLRDDDTEARENIDASGKVILPGVIDLHAHTRTPGLSYKEDFLTATQAAAHGGITTIVDMPNVEPPTDSAELLLEKRAIAEKDCIVDWGHFASGSKPENVQALAEAGATGYKIFMVGGGYPHDDRIAVVDDRQLYRSFEAIAKTGLPCLVHPFNQALFDLFSERVLAEGKPPNYETRVEVYTNRDIVWSSAVATALRIQKDTGVRLVLLHTHATGSLLAIRKAKAEGQRVVAVIDPKYFHLTRADMERNGPRSYHGIYVTADPERMELIWSSLKDGTLDTIDSDHGPHTREEMEYTAVDAWKAQGGNAQYDNMLSIFLNDVNQGKLTLEQLSRLMSENPARVLGCYPEKGAILPGSLADLVMVDMEREIEIRDEDVYSKVKWTPYLGWKVKGVPVLTMSRGTVVALDGRVIGEPGHGRYIPGRPQAFAEIVDRRYPGLALQPRREAGVPAGSASSS